MTPAWTGQVTLSLSLSCGQGAGLCPPHGQAPMDAAPRPPACEGSVLESTASDFDLPRFTSSKQEPTCPEPQGGGTSHVWRKRS